MIIFDVATYQPVKKAYDDPGAITNIDSSLSVYLQNSKKQLESSHVLKEVVIRSTRPTHVSYTSLTGLPPVPDQVLGPEILKDCGFDFEGCVLGRVFGLWRRGESLLYKKDA